MRVIIKFFAKILALCVYRVKIIGKENIPQNGPAIICANHVSLLDATVFILTSKRKVNVLAKDDLFRSAIGKWFAKVFGIYPVKRNSADINAIKISLKLLKNDELLFLFPEGTRNGIAKGVKPKNGAVMMAIKSGVSIIPVGIKGNFKPFTKVVINIGQPISYSEYKEKKSDKEFINDLTNSLMEEILRLRDEKC